MKKFISLLMLVILIFSCSACSNNAELEALKKENEQLKAQLSGDLPAEINEEESGNEAIQDGTISYGQIKTSEFSDCLSDGIYRCGTDMESGDYYVLSPYGNAGYEVTDSADEVSWSGHACIFKKIHIEDGQYINVDFAVLIPVDRFNRDDWSKYGAFLVGKDLAAGEYRVSSKGSNNVSSYQITVGEPDSEIIKSSTLHGSQEYVSLSDGQYIMLNNIVLTPVEN